MYLGQQAQVDEEQMSRTDRPLLVVIPVLATYASSCGVHRDDGGGGWWLGQCRTGNPVLLNGLPVTGLERSRGGQHPCRLRDPKCVSIASTSRIAEVFAASDT